MSIATTESTTLNLSDLPKDAPALIDLIEASEFEQLRLNGLGLCEGRRVRKVKSGDPMILQVMGVRIALAQSLARLVRVAQEA